VHDSVVVCVVERPRDFARESQSIVHRELSLAIEALAQRLAFDVGHDVVEQSVRRARV